MSDIVIGIDLGTTNSCVAIPESAEVHRKDELVAEGRLLPVGGALVLTDHLQAPTIPSAVWIDGDGSVVVGRLAKQKTKLPDEPRPALFFKRLMGHSEVVTAGHGELSPEEASSHVLRALKDMAEEVLGAEIGRAVVTVPAFFAVNARQATTRAGELAGLEVVDTLLEPVAAALMYTRTTTLEEPRTFMVYDLGGGTFDASIVTWDPEVGFEMKAFDGDTHLGGYDFDRAIVNWMVDQLGDRYDLDFDLENNPSDASLFYRMLVHAESDKQVLSRELETMIVDATSEDRAGNPMTIRLPLSRPEFIGLIEERIAKTLASAERALETAGVKPDDLDEIIMVGGSSEIPVVRERLEERFGRQPRVIDPHLCVAVGAALKAASVATASTYLLLDRPATPTPLEAIDLSGTVQSGPDLPSVAGVSVRLTSDDGETDREETTNESGKFLFLEVPLRPEATNAFTVRVSSDGGELDSQRFDVEHAVDEPPPLADDTSGHVLPHDVSIEVRDGFELVAAAATPLPSHQAVLLRLGDQSGQVRVRIYDGNQHVGEVAVEDLPRSLPTGSPVEVDLVFNADWTIDTTARVKTGETEAVADAKIVIPTTPLPSWESLRQQQVELVADWSGRQQLGAQVDLLRDGPRINELLQDALDLINEGQDRAHAHECLREAETLIKGVRIDGGEAGLEPPLEEFEEAVDRCERLIDRKEAQEGQDAARSYRDSLASLRNVGMAAYEAKNQADWAYANENLKRRIAALDEGPGGPPPPAIAFQLWGKSQLDEMLQQVAQADAATNGQFADDVAQLRSDAQALYQSLEDVDLSDEDAARARLQGICGGKIQPFGTRVGQWLKGLKETGEGGPGIPDRHQGTIPAAGSQRPQKLS